MCEDAAARGGSNAWGRSSVGRAPESHSGGRRFESARLHQTYHGFALGRHSRFCGLCLRRALRGCRSLSLTLGKFSRSTTKHARPLFVFTSGRCGGPMPGGPRVAVAALSVLAHDSICLHRAIYSLCRAGWAFATPILLRTMLDALLSVAVITRSARPNVAAFKFFYAGQRDVLQDLAESATAKPEAQANVAKGYCRCSHQDRQDRLGDVGASAPGRLNPRRTRTNKTHPGHQACAAAASVPCTRADHGEESHWCTPQPARGATAGSQRPLRERRHGLAAAPHATGS
jgi:hypothetical protein